MDHEVINVYNNVVVSMRLTLCIISWLKPHVVIGSVASGIHVAKS